MKGDREHRPERGAARDAERVGSRERVAKQRLKHHAGRGQRGADEGRRHHTRESRDEEDLRVEVVGERHRAVEDTRERDGRRPDDRREHNQRGQSRALPRDRDRRRRWWDATHDQAPPDRHDREVAGGRMPGDVRFDAVERAHRRRRQHLFGRTGGQHLAVFAAERDGGTSRRQVQVVRRQHIVTPWLGIQLPAGAAAPRSGGRCRATPSVRRAGAVACSVPARWRSRRAVFRRR